MSSKTIIFTRDDLYNKVWEKVLKLVAEDYGLTENVLKRICIKMNIPIPYNGYWAKLKYHKDVFKTPLPAIKPVDLETFELEIKEKKEKDILERYKKLIELEEQPEYKITVPESVARLHPLVKETKKIVSKARVGYRDDFLRVHRGKIFALVVTPKTFIRAIPVLNTLVIELEKRGFKIEVPKDDDEWVVTKLLFDNQVYEIELRELSKYEMREIQNLYSHKKELQKFKAATGVLKIAVKRDDGWEKITLVQDTKKIKVEDQMNRFFICLYETINNEIIKQREIDKYWEIQREKMKEEKRIEDERKREEKRTKDLLKLAKAWNRVKYISTFLDEMESVMKEKNLLTEENKNWFTWARRKLMILNPIGKVGVFKI